MMLGIDFGTSNSAAALVDDAGQLQVIALEQHNSSMPTALFFSPERLMWSTSPAAHPRWHC